LDYVIFVANGKGLVGKEVFLEKHVPTLPTLGARQDAFTIHFDWDADFWNPRSILHKELHASS